MGTEGGPASLEDFLPSFEHLHLMYRSANGGAGVVAATGRFAEPQFDNAAPSWIVDDIKAATAALWNAIHSYQPMEPLPLPRSCLHFFVECFPVPADSSSSSGNSSSSSSRSNSSSDLLSKVGFDVEEVHGWTPPYLAEYGIEPVSHTFLRIVAMDCARDASRKDHLEQGDIIIAFFGHDDCSELHSRLTFAAACSGLPFVFFVVYRGAGVVAATSKVAELRAAIEHGDANAVVSLVAAKVDISSMVPRQPGAAACSLLRIAVEAGNAEIVKLVADPQLLHATDSVDGATVLHTAIQHDSLDTVKVLLDAKVGGCALCARSRWFVCLFVCTTPPRPLLVSRSLRCSLRIALSSTLAHHLCRLEVRPKQCGVVPRARSCCRHCLMHAHHLVASQPHGALDLCITPGCVCAPTLFVPVHSMPRAW
jgi:hypothetical protein